MTIPTAIPKVLYHGTSSKALRRIAKEGITPRGPRKGNWGTYASAPDRTYLTTCFGGYYAGVATNKPGTAIVLRVDTDRLDAALWNGDEDAWGQSIHQVEGITLLEAQLKAHRLLKTPSRRAALMSLAALGSASYHGTIHPEAITGVALIRLGTRLIMDLMDPVICIPAYQAIGAKYEALHAGLFNPDIEIHPFGFPIDLATCPPEMLEHGKPKLFNILYSGEFVTFPDVASAASYSPRKQARYNTHSTGGKESPGATGGK